MNRVRFSLHSNAYKFGSRLKELREEKGLKQKEFAEVFTTHDSQNQKIGITLDTVQNWEQHYNLPDTGTLLDLADFFDVNVDYLLGTIDTKKHVTEDVSKITLLSPKAIETIMNNRETIHPAPPTEEQIKRLDQAVKDGEISGWSPLESFEDIDTRNVDFLNTLIESDHFSQLYALFEDYTSSIEDYKKILQDIDVYNKYSHLMTEEQKKQSHVEIKDIQNARYGMDAAMLRLSNAFNSFLDTLRPKKEN